MGQTIQVPAEAVLEEARRLLEAMGFRGVVPYAATPQRLMQICQRIDAARWSRARDVANVIAEFGAAPYVVFVMSVGQKKVCVPDVVIDGPGLYYVHEVDCRGRTVQCADLARAILDELTRRKTRPTTTKRPPNTPTQKITQIHTTRHHPQRHSSAWFWFVVVSVAMNGVSQ